jgi:hypothetical protein
LAEQSHIVIDIRNFVSWFSLLKVTQVFGELRPEDILELRGVDSETRKDLFKVLPASAYHLLRTDCEDDDGFLQLQIQKRV